MTSASRIIRGSQGGTNCEQREWCRLGGRQPPGSRLKNGTNCETGSPSSGAGFEVGAPAPAQVPPAAAGGQVRLETVARFCATWPPFTGVRWATRLRGDRRIEKGTCPPAQRSPKAMGEAQWGPGRALRKGREGA